MTRTTRLGAGSAVALLLSATLHPSPAAAADEPLACGAVITHNATLTADIGPCSAGGLIVSGDNVILNLAGFVIKGNSDAANDGVGILVSNDPTGSGSNVTGVTVKNGRVTDFDAGVVLDGGSGHVVKNLLVKDNVGDGSGDFGDGIAVSSSNGNTIRDNDVIRNGLFDGIGLFGPSSDNFIVNNVVGENNVQFVGEDGIRIEGPGAKNNTVRGNTVSGSTLDGIAIFSDQVTGNLNTGNKIINNLVVANGFGILGARPGEGITTFLRANDNTIRGNTVRDNAGSGILIGSGSLNNTIRSNVATGNGRRASAARPRFDLHDLNVDCDNNVWRANLAGTAFPSCTTGG